MIYDEAIETLLRRAKRRLGQELNEEEEQRLTNALYDAEEELLLYLNRLELREQMYGKVVELAVLFYHRDHQEGGGVKSSSYSEGDVSQSVTYQTDTEYRAAVDAVLRSVSHWRRRVRC